MAGSDGGAVEDDRAAVAGLRSELEVVGGGALADYGGRAGGAAVDGEEEAAVGYAGAGEGDDRGGVGAGAGFGAGLGEGAGAESEDGGGEGDGDWTV